MSIDHNTCSLVHLCLISLPGKWNTAFLIASAFLWNLQQHAYAVCPLTPPIVYKPILSSYTVKIVQWRFLMLAPY
uniref:Uncharacterized protein n=1 Tax=Paramormyrops kingsleyae TaxID=1676925 RepID=A0A3B3SGX9_9TELE